MAERWEQIEQIFNRAMEQDPAVRAAFVEEACDGDESLRHEVVSLLRYERAARRFIETPAIEDLAEEIGQADDALPAGHQIGPYTIISLLGEGGMGEVYRARDSQLGRDVAIKALPAAFALDVARVRRLEREARLLASVNHPNIASIYGVEQALGMQFLILELVEGETLADRLVQGPIPVDEALGFARQIAEALEAAHLRDVIHRDLKPSNIRVTADGRVKVLDFGLAKASHERDELPLSDEARPPDTDAETRHGAVVGTLAYMSPEQARGEGVDHRTDIWAFGCVFFEMLTGHPVCKRESLGELLASSPDPDLRSLPSGIDPALRSLIARCLAIPVADRPNSARDLRLELEHLLSDPEMRSLPAGRDAMPPASAGWVGRVAAVALLATGVAWALRRSTDADGPEEPGICRFCGGKIHHDHCAEPDETRQGDAEPAGYPPSAPSSRQSHTLAMRQSR